jgi:hypothetical protein
MNTRFTGIGALLIGKSKWTEGEILEKEGKERRMEMISKQTITNRQSKQTIHNDDIS